MTVTFDDLDFGGRDLAADSSIVQPGFQNQATAHEKVFGNQMTGVFFSAVLLMRGKKWIDLAKTWVSSGFSPDEFNRIITDQFVSTFSTGASGVLKGGAKLGALTAEREFGDQPIPLEEDVADAWSQVYSHRLAAQVGLTSQQAVEAMVKDGINQRLPAAALADRVSSLYGLDSRAVNALKAYSSTGKVSRDQTVMDMANKMLAARGDLIGSNEVFTAINFGRQMTFMKAVHMKILSKDAHKTWLTAIDERVCPVCRPMDGISVPINDVFNVVMPLPKTGRGRNRKSVAHIVPPVHPNCRCTIVLTDKVKRGMITRGARFDDIGDKHRARLLSDSRDVLYP